MAKHCIFVCCDAPVFFDSVTKAILLDDDTTLGILPSRFQKARALLLVTSLEIRLRYSRLPQFQLCPFSRLGTQYTRFPISQRSACGCDSKSRKNSSILAKSLVESTSSVGVDGKTCAKMPGPLDERSAKTLRNRTLTKPYTASPQWLAVAHGALDSAVATVFG